MQLLAADGVTVLATTQTAADGTYAFGPAEGVTEGGTFFVRETQPAQYGNAATNPGTGATTPSSDLIRVANVPVAGSSNNNFGEIAGSVLGRVTNQTSNTPIAGVQIVLTGKDAAGKDVRLTATTDAAGNYKFANVPLSSDAGYTVTEPQPPATSNGPTTAGTTGGVASNPSSNSSTIVGVKVSGNTSTTLDSSGNDFAELSVIDLATRTTGVANSDGTGTFTVTASNVGSQPAPNVRATMRIAAGLTGMVISNGGTYDPATGIVSWPPISNLAIGASAAYTVTAPMSPGAILTAASNALAFAAPASTTPLSEDSATNNPSSADLSAAPTSIPTLSGWLLILLSALIFGMPGLRRRVCYRR